MILIVTFSFLGHINTIQSFYYSTYIFMYLKYFICKDFLETLSNTVSSIYHLCTKEHLPFRTKHKNNLFLLRNSCVTFLLAEQSLTVLLFPFAHWQLRSKLEVLITRQYPVYCTFSPSVQFCIKMCISSGLRFIYSIFTGL